MAIYTYAAINPQTNQTIEGTLEAANLREAKERLREDGHIPTKLEEQVQSLTVEDLMSQVPVLGDFMVPKFGLKELTIFTQQLVTLLDAGVPLIEALFLLEQQSENKRLKELLHEIRNDVMAGSSFSQAVNRYKRDFSALYVNMVHAGEVSGELDKVCLRLAALLEKNWILQTKIFNALTYPAFTLLVVVGVVIIIMVVVVPQFENLFTGYGAELPLPTKFLMTTSDIFTNFWWAFLIGFGAAGYAFNLFRKGGGKPLIDQWMLTIPLLGDVFTKMYASRFVRTLATVLSSGVSLTEGLATSAATIDNYVLRVSFDRCKESILAGGTLSRPLEQTKVFPIMVTKMIAIGEETGKMDAMMFKSADFLDVEVDRAIENLTTMIEPIMIIVLGGMILAVALALYIPLFEMGNVVTGSI